MSIRESYDAAADAYATHLADEFDRKPARPSPAQLLRRGSRRAGRVAVLGRGPGHIARYLRSRVDVVGIGLSPEMIRVAKASYPEIEFRLETSRRSTLPRAPAPARSNSI